MRFVSGIVLCVSMVACVSKPQLRGHPMREAHKDQTSEFGVELVLDQWHAAAAHGVFDRYIELMTDDAVFLGTDESERWSKDQFMGYAREPFADGNGWVYTPRDRFVALSSDRYTAWVDEVLDNEKYGVLRGTAVLELVNNDWKIAHYSLTMLVPNEKMRDVVEVIGSP